MRSNKEEQEWEYLRHKRRGKLRIYPLVKQKGSEEICYFRGIERAWGQ